VWAPAFLPAFLLVGTNLVSANLHGLAAYDWLKAIARIFLFATIIFNVKVRRKSQLEFTLSHYELSSNFQSE
jgi:hypothetical protein